MKKKNTSIACGLSAVSLLAFALAACETDVASSSGEVLPNSSEDVQIVSSSSADEQPASSSDMFESFSSETVASSSSVIASSSSRKVECITMSRLCPPCDDREGCPISAMPCSQCYSMYGAETYDCETNERYVCSRFDTWDRTCYNLTDSNGNIAEDSCSLNYGAWLDCKTNKPFVCKEGRWERLPEEYSWVHQKCDSSETDRQINIEYETEKGSIAIVSSVFSCDGVSWRQGGTTTLDRSLCEKEDDKVTIKGKTYRCINGEWYSP